MYMTTAPSARMSDADDEHVVVRRRARDVGCAHGSSQEVVQELVTCGSQAAGSGTGAAGGSAAAPPGAGAAGAGARAPVRRAPAAAWPRRCGGAAPRRPRRVPALARDRRGLLPRRRPPAPHSGSGVVGVDRARRQPDVRGQDVAALVVAGRRDAPRCRRSPSRSSTKPRFSSVGNISPAVRALGSEFARVLGCITFEHRRRAAARWPRRRAARAAAAQRRARRPARAAACRPPRG